MIVEFGLPATVLPALSVQLPTGAELRRASSLNRAEQHLWQASGFVLGLPAGPATETLTRLRLMRRQHPWLPIIAAGPLPVTGLDARDRLALQQAGVDHVLPWSFTPRPARDDEPPAPSLLAGEWRTLPLRRMAAMVRHVTHIAPLPRQLMVIALCATRPLTSVEELATLADRHRASMWKLWRATARPVPTAGRFLDWVQLLSLVAHKDTGRTWRAVAEQVGMRPSSVARLARRVLGRPLSTFEAPFRYRLFVEFMQGMLLLSPREIRDLIELAPPPLLAIDPRGSSSLRARAGQRRAADLASDTDDADDAFDAPTGATEVTSARNASTSSDRSWRRVPPADSATSA
jgi:hypothetical protein